MLLLALSAPVYAATLTVGPTQPYTTIGAALAAAASGDTIQVEPGTYAEAIDLRGRNVTLTSTRGPRVTTLAPTQYIGIDGGTLSGFRISPAPSTAVMVTSGSPTLRELVVEGPSIYGIEVLGGSPTIQECAVVDSGLHAFIFRAGTPTVLRNVAVDPVGNGFSVQAAVNVQNNLAIGGQYGFMLQSAGATVSHGVAVGTSIAAVGSSAAGAVSNSAFTDNATLLKCNGGDTAFATSVAWNGTSASGCTAAPAVTQADPVFTRWESGSELWQLDFHPAAGSPLSNAGTGTDTDGSLADIGLFGGAQGAWSDQDRDGAPVLFDCDDHDATTFPGATERGDGLDNDCDGALDEDVPVDTGGGDTGGDSGLVDTGETGDTGADPARTDLDGDGYFADVDCSEHNVATHPYAPERTDGADNDCDGAVDEGTVRGDDDGDGYSELTGDCDDTDRERHPGAEDDESGGWENHVDDDCDGLDDDAEGLDRDGDGYLDSVDDCDDEDPAVHPGAEDVTDGVDNECDGRADDPLLDSDADGDGVTVGGGDCDDGDPGVFAGNPEIADDFVDQDCTGEDLYDQDADGHASPASGGADCDDLNSSVHPGQTEACDDGDDDDCDGEVDDGCEVEAGATAPEGCGCDAAMTPGNAGLLGALAALLVRIRRRETA